MNTPIKPQHRKINTKTELEDIVNIGDTVEISLNQNKKLMTYGGLVDRIYHSFLRLSEDKKSIICWMSEIQHLRYQDGVIIFDNLNRKIDIYSHSSKEYEAKKKILE